MTELRELTDELRLCLLEWMRIRHSLSAKMKNFRKPSLFDEFLLRLKKRFKPFQL